MKPRGLRSLRLGLVCLTLVLPATLLAAAPDASAQGETLVFNILSGPSGAPLTVSGTGWSVDLGDVFVFSSRESNDTANAFAHFPPQGESSTTVPSMTPGPYTFYACQACGDPDGFPSATQEFTVTTSDATSDTPPPRLFLTPSGGAPGDRIDVSGTGWSGEEAVSVFSDRELSTDPTKSVIEPIVPDSTGTFKSTMAVPDDLSPATYTFYACELCASLGEGEHATHAFKVLTVGSSAPAETQQPTPSDAKFVLTPHEGPAGAHVLVTATGWSAGIQVFVFANQADSPHAEKALTHGTPGRRGRFDAAFDVPDGFPEGLATFYACQNCDQSGARSDHEPFKVTLLAVVPTTLLVDPNSGQPGDTRTVSGAGWTTGIHPVYIFASESESGDVNNAIKAVTVDLSGVFSTTLTVPDRDPRDYTFYACQRCSDPENRSTAVSAFTIERDGLRWWDVAGGILLLVAAAAAGAGVATAWHHRRVKLTRGHRLEPHDDPDIEVELLPLHGRPLPTVRLVPRDDGPVEPIEWR